MAGQEYHCPCCESSPCRKLSGICARSFIASCATAPWLTVIWWVIVAAAAGRYSEIVWIVKVHCLNVHGNGTQRYKKSLSPTKCGKRHLKTDSFCAIIAQGIQVSRVPSQILHICRGTASSNGRQSKGRSRGAYSFVHLYYITFLEILQGLFEKKLNKF